MQFLDLTHKNPTKQEKNLSDSELKHLIKSESGRDLVFEDKNLHLLYDKRFKLVHLPEPIEFLLEQTDPPNPSKSRPLLYFFSGNRVTAGCEPPPNYQVINGRTCLSL